MRTSTILALASALLLSGCITAYEPTTGAPAFMPARTVRPAPPPPAVPVVSIVPHEIQPPPAIPDTPAGRQLGFLVRILSTGDTRDMEDRFAPAFLQQVPGAQLERIVHEWRRDELGVGPVDLVQVEQEAPDSLTAFVRGITGRYSQIRMNVDDRGRIAGLLLAPAIGFRPGIVETWGQFDDQLAGLPGQLAFGAWELLPPAGDAEPGTLRPIHTVNESAQLSIGSTFKLYLLGTLAEAVQEGRASWTDEIEVLDELKSLPSGQMQLDLEGTIYQLSRVAELMISISDNTATDHLLAYLGRDPVEQYMARLHSQPGRNRPFLSTMEFFRLKLGPDRVNVAARYAEADESTRRAMLAPGGEVAEASPSLVAAAIWRTPFEIDRIGWFASASDLAELMRDLRRIEQQEDMEPLSRALRRNPGLAFDPRTWTSIAYKGGSEPGVLNMTWLLRRHDDRWFIMTMTWNDPRRGVETRRMAEIVGAAAGLLAEEGLR
jgi:hypothetical protein